MTSSPPQLPSVVPYAHRVAPPTDDLQHLKLLAVFHYVLAGIFAFFGCFPIIHLAIGIASLNGSMGGDLAFGLIFTVVGAGLILCFWSVAVLILISGRGIARRQGRTFSMVVAGVACAFFPLGTTLGVFTLIVLLRDSVKGLYATCEAAPVAPPAAETA